MGTALLKQQPQVKYLGVILDEKLSWSPHIDMVKRKVSSAVWALSRLRSVASEETLRTVYFSLVHSKLKYCISTWGSAAVTKLKKLEPLQKRAMRIICQAPRLAHSEPLFKAQKVLKLTDIYKLQIAIIMAKFNSGMWLGNFSPVNVSRVHDHQTRYATNNNFIRPKAYNDTFKRSLSYSGPLIWSSVPEDLKRLPPNQIKLKYKEHLLQNYNE